MLHASKTKTIWMMCLAVLILSINPDQLFANDDLDVLKAKIHTKFSSIENIRITYRVKTKVLPASGQWLEKVSNSLNKLKTEKRKSTNNNDMENLNKQIAEHEKMIDGFFMEDLYIYSRSANKKRLDVYRTTEKPNHFYYLFDGEDGYIILEDVKEIQKATSFSINWKKPYFCPEFAINTNQFITGGFSVNEYDNVNQTFVISSPVYYRNNARYTFSLKDDVYWDQCIGQYGENGEKFIKVLCSNFNDIGGGIKMPSKIVIQKKRKGEFHEHQVYDFEEIEINSISFEPGYFALPSLDEYKVRNLRR